MKIFIFIFVLFLYGCSSSDSSSVVVSEDIVIEEEFIEPSYKITNNGNGDIEIDVLSKYKFSLFVGLIGSFSEDHIEVHVYNDVVFVRLNYYYDNKWHISSEGYSQVR